MRRIAVIGSCGAGKSQLSIALGARLGLPVVHLDRLHWLPGWVERPRAEFDAALDAALPPDGAWIVDGNYGRSMPMRLSRADTVVWLDLPTAICLARVLRRNLRHRHRGRPDMTEGCAERVDRQFLEFLHYVATFRRVQRPKIVEKLRALGPGQRLITLTSPRQVERWLAGVAPAPA